MNRYKRLGRLVDRLVRADLSVTFSPNMIEVGDDFKIEAHCRIGQGEGAIGPDALDAFEKVLAKMRDDPFTQLDLTNLDDMVPWCETCDAEAEMLNCGLTTCLHEAIYVEKDDV